MDYLTMRNKFKAITQFDDYSADMILGIEIENGGLEGAIKYVDDMIVFRRMHSLAESLEKLGHDPLDALEALYDAYAVGGVPKMEGDARRMMRG